MCDFPGGGHCKGAMDETTPPASDAELLRRHAVARDEAAFAELVRRHLALVYFAALRQVGGDAHRAEDVAQVVFARLARQATALARHPALAGWLHTTTRFAASEAMRAERRRTAREHEAHAMQQLHSDPDPAAHADWARLRPVIDQALGDLGEADREAVLLRFFAGLPLALVGARLNVSENAARMRVERALGKLEALLAKRGVTSTSAALGLALGSQAALAAPTGLAASVTSAALAGATATGAVATAGIFTFMSTAKIMTGVAVVIGAIGVGTAVQGHRAADRAEAAMASLRREADALKAQAAQSDTRVREAGERARAGEARVSALQQEIANAKAGPRATQPSAPTAPAAGFNPMLGHPEYFRLAGEKYRAELAQKFWPLYRRLNLTPEQIARFEANRTASHQATTEVLSSAQAKGVAPGDSAVAKLAGEATLPFETELMALLGEEGYREYLRHNRASAGVALVKELVGALAWSAAPLSATQGERLALDMIAETRAVPVAPGSRSVRHVTDWDAFATLGRSVLTPEQMPAFQAVLDARKLQERMTEISRIASAPKPAP